MGALLRLAWRALNPDAPEPPPGARLVIRINSNVKMTRGKAAAQAVHAALLLLRAHPGVPVIVLGASRAEVEACTVRVHDAGRTEVEAGTLTAGASWESP